MTFAPTGGQVGQIKSTGRRRLDESAMYQAMLESVTEQLQPQIGLARPGQVAALMMIPVVGFGEQSPAVLRRTLDVVASQHCPETVITCVILVNRPLACTPDSTEGLVRSFIERLPAGNRSVQLALATVQLPRKPKIGELRQLMLDASAEVLKFSPSTTGLIIADDDLVNAGPEYVHRIIEFLRHSPEVDLAIGPVLFDDDRFPSALLVDFFVADLLRALLATRTVEHVSSLDPSNVRDWREMDRISRMYFESVILSGNLGVRVSALEEAGGFADMNELTTMMRDVHDLVLAAEGPRRSNLGSTWSFDAQEPDVMDRLLASAVQVSSRRAIHAYRQGGRPSVAQWRKCRFRAAKIDPVRVTDPAPFDITPIRHLGRTGRQQMIADIEQSIKETLEYFPPRHDTVVECIRALGLGARECAIELEQSIPTRWNVRITGGHELLERVQAVQDRVLERMNIAREQRLLQLPVEAVR